MDRKRFFFSSASLLSLSSSSRASASLLTVGALVGLNSSAPISPSLLVLISSLLLAAAEAEAPPFQDLGLATAPKTPSRSSSSEDMYPAALVVPLAAGVGLPWRAKSSMVAGLVASLLLLAAVGDLKSVSTERWPWAAARARRLAATDVDSDGVVGVGREGMAPKGS